MKYATKVPDIANAFSAKPLRVDQMSKFYHNGVMEYRTGDKYSSPIEDILDICQGEAHNPILLSGYRGCGKSTELNWLSVQLEEAGYPVKVISCRKDLDLFNISCFDLLILMGEALLKIANECKCVGNNILSSVMHILNKSAEIADAETARLFKSVFSTFEKIRVDLKYNEQAREEYRRRLHVHSSEWLVIFCELVRDIVTATGGKVPIIIFDDLDKLNIYDVWKIFYDHASLLSGVSFPVIYTFPVGISYDDRLFAMENYFVVKSLPLIKTEIAAGEVFQDGVSAIEQIVEKRADLNLFELRALRKMIQYTGGSLGDLFTVISMAAKRAERRGSDIVSIEDAKSALIYLRSSLIKRLEKSDYDFFSHMNLMDMALILNKQILMKLQRESVILEYGEKYKYQVHPLVLQFLKE